MERTLLVMELATVATLIIYCFNTLVILLVPMKKGLESD